MLNGIVAGKCFGFPFHTRELKQRQRRRQRERHKFAYLVAKNNSFARPARAVFTFFYFLSVVCKTTTCNSQIWGWGEIFIFSPKLSAVLINVIFEELPHPCHIKKVEIVTIRQIYIMRWRSRCRRCRRLTLTGSFSNDNTDGNKNVTNLHI